MKTKSEEELVALCLLKDTSAFAELERRYRNFVFFKISKFITDKELQKDIAQNVWIKVWNIFDKKKYIVGNYNLSHLLTLAVMNVSIDLLRNQKQIKSKHELYVFKQVSQTETSFIPEVVTYEELKRKTEFFLNGLKEKERDVFRLYVFEEFSYQEISENLGIPLGSVRALIFRVRKKIPFDRFG